MIYKIYNLHVTYLIKINFLQLYIDLYFLIIHDFCFLLDSFLLKLIKKNKINDKQ